MQGYGIREYEFPEGFAKVDGRKEVMPEYCLRYELVNRFLFYFTVLYHFPNSILSSYCHIEINNLLD